ncbi:MAG TPA: ATP-binding cassette domain-containing protein [Gammaproteobacteria bacterium]|nr:ATP-binding cassette domain-containing protein [Gammaproteobacteria bacterium]
MKHSVEIGGGVAETVSGDSENFVDLRDLSFCYGSRVIFDHFSLQVPRGKVTVIMGPSGCGKSTLLGFIGGRQRPQSGKVIVNGRQVNGLAKRDLYELRKSMGMMFQNSALLTDLDVFDNVAFPLRTHTDLPATLIRKLVLMKLQQVGLRGARHLLPAELSGGMTRRVALARAVVLDPLMVMYDEPFTGLDPVSMGVIVKLIRELNDSLCMTSVVVTHDVPEGLSIADRVYLLGAGNVVASGDPDYMRTFDHPVVRQFIDGLPDGPVAYHYPAEDYRQELLGRAQP